MVEETDFRVEWPDFDFRRLGRRLISINLSDLAAMGAEPRYALVSLTLRGTLPVADVNRLYQGIAEQARRFSCAIAGGDVSGTLGLLTLTATLVGRLDSARSVLRRDGVRAGWLLAVTGSLGGAAAGLRLLESRRRPSTARERRWVSAQLDPTPRVIAGRVLVDTGIRVGGDISDGLHREVERLLDGTRLGATIDVERLPLAQGLSRKEWALAVKDSEDFELVCAAPAARVAAARRVLERIKLPLTVVGEIEARPGIRLRNGSRMERLQGAGFEHFR